ncbi:hypothetical protein VTL71DRAFT_124 [Oculimacula yallundae]|uniref:Uncharacterized protein n=1 Tax=Oculimacula yallundae TaxID=86028 RepID=A0ABR4D033_9HELO
MPTNFIIPLIGIMDILEVIIRMFVLAIIKISHAISHMLGLQRPDPNAPVEGVRMVPEASHSVYNQRGQFENAVEYWRKHLYSVPSVCKPYMKPSGYPRSLLTDCLSADKVPVTKPVQEWSDRESLPEGFDPLASSGRELHKLISVTPEGKWKVSVTSTHLVTALLFTKCKLDTKDIDEALPQKIRKIGGSTVAHSEGRKQLKTHAASIMTMWLKQVILPFALDMFLRFQKEPRFIAAANADSMTLLIEWYQGKLHEQDRVKLYYCLQRPWGKAISLDSLFHADSGTTQGEKAFFAKARDWAALLTATACASVAFADSPLRRYCNAIQIRNGQAEPTTNWAQVKQDIRALPTSESGMKLRIDPMKLPSSSEFGTQTRVSGRYAGNTPGFVDEQIGSDEELLEQ